MSLPLRISKRTIFSPILNSLFAPKRWWSRASYSPEKVDGILVMALNSFGVGNTVLLTPLLSSLRRGFVNSRLNVVVSSALNAQILHMCPAVNEVILLEENGLKSGHAFLQSLVAERSCQLILSTFLDSDFYPSLWRCFAGARWSAGYTSWTNGLMDTFTMPQNEGIHEVERHLEMAKRLGINMVSDDLGLEIRDRERSFARTFFQAHGIKGGEAIIGIHPGSGDPGKQWPLERFAHVGREIGNRSGARVIYFSGPNERDLSRRIRQLVGGAWNCHFADDQGITETAALIEHCQLFISNDSGLMHIAAAMKVPVVAIFGPTIPWKNHPWKVPHTIVRADMQCSPCYTYEEIGCKDQRCLDSVSVEMVLDAADKQLAAISAGLRGAA